MDFSHGSIQKMYEEQGKDKINKLLQKIVVTEYNMEVSGEIIASTPSDAQRTRLREKNTRRRHAIGSMEKEIRDLRQTIEARSREVST